MDTQGNYDVVMPEPMDGTSSGYKVRVGDAVDEENVDCSSDFTLAASTDDTVVSSDRHLYVTSPEEGDMAFAGQEYTVEVRTRRVLYRVRGDAGHGRGGVHLIVPEAPHLSSSTICPKTGFE